MKTGQYEIRQFKLSNGDEIVCEIIEWNNEEELELVTRKVMKLVQSEANGVKYFVFRPWMIYQESLDEFIILNGNHVIGIGYPTEPLLFQYYEALKEMEKMHETRKEEYAEMSEEDIKEVSKMVSKTSDKIDEYLKTLRESGTNDSDGGANVIDIFSKETIH